MSLASDIPVNIRILRYPCRVFYKGQPRPCSICRDPDHRAPHCPLRDVCRRCRQPGHFARDCKSFASVVTPVVAETDDAGYDAEDDCNDEDDDEDYVDVAENASIDDDIGSSDDELCSGDEEVLSSAPVDLPPRSSTSDPVPSVPSPRPPVASSASAPSVPAPSVSSPRTAVPPAPAPSVPAPSVPSPRPTTVSPAPAPPVPVPTVLSPRPPTVSPVSPPCPAPVPMDTGLLLQADRPLWVKRLPDDVVAQLSHLTKDCHAGHEYYPSGSVPVAFDFGTLTYRILKETRYFEEDRFYAYLTSLVDRPVPTAFVRPATNRPALSKDIVPAKFPSSR